MNGHSEMNGHCKQNGSGSDDRTEFLDELFEMMKKDVFIGSRDRNARVVNFKHPAELEKMLDLHLDQETQDQDLLKICKDVIQYSVKTGEVNKKC